MTLFAAANSRENWPGMTDGPGPIRGFVEDRRFSEQLEQLGGAALLDDVLRPVFWALARNPEAFLLVPGFPNVRIIKTKGYRFQGRDISPLRIWFSIEADGTIRLRAIEPYQLADFDIDPSETF